MGSIIQGLKTPDLDCRGQGGFEKLGTTETIRGQTMNHSEWECFSSSFVINECSLKATSKVKRSSDL